MGTDLEVGQKVYYARILPQAHVYEVYDLTIRGVYDGYFVALEKHEKRAFLFPIANIGECVFLDREECLELVLQKESEDREELDG